MALRPLGVSINIKTVVGAGVGSLIGTKEVATFRGIITFIGK